MGKRPFLILNLIFAANLDTDNAFNSSDYVLVRRAFGCYMDAIKKKDWDQNYEKRSDDEDDDIVVGHKRSLYVLFLYEICIDLLHKRYIIIISRIGHRGSSV